MDKIYTSLWLAVLCCLCGASHGQTDYVYADRETHGKVYLGQCPGSRILTGPNAYNITCLSAGVGLKAMGWTEARFRSAERPVLCPSHGNGLSVRIEGLEAMPPQVTVYNSLLQKLGTLEVDANGVFSLSKLARAGGAILPSN